ncbi:hypothetical protein C8K36_1162 [Rhodococcus sp. OK519]|nr:hypothetical protein C8K36_1162 [Rhodococcus sp. OK519]
MRFRDDQVPSRQTASPQPDQELTPELERLRVADRSPEDPPGAVDDIPVATTKAWETTCAPTRMLAIGRVEVEEVVDAAG